jgi:hypothetical protein
VDAYGSVRVWVEEQNAGDATLLCLVLPYGTANPRSESLSGASPAAGGGNFRSRLFLSLPALHVSRVTRESFRPCQTNSAPVTIRQVFFLFGHICLPPSLSLAVRFRVVRPRTEMWTLACSPIPATNPARFRSPLPAVPTRPSAPYLASNHVAAVSTHLHAQLPFMTVEECTSSTF